MWASIIDYAFANKFSSNSMSSLPPEYAHPLHSSLQLAAVVSCKCTSPQRLLLLL